MFYAKHHIPIFLKPLGKSDLKYFDAKSRYFLFCKKKKADFFVSWCVDAFEALLTL